MDPANNSSSAVGAHAADNSIELDFKPTWLDEPVSRRSVMLSAFGSFAVGSVLGFGFVQSGVPAAEEVVAGDGHASIVAPDSPPGSAAGDAQAPAESATSRLQRARELAAGPIDDLCDEAICFITVCNDWPGDGELRAGVVRLVEHLVASRDAEDQRVVASVVLAHLRYAPRADARLDALVPDLRRLAR